MTTPIGVLDISEMVWRCILSFMMEYHKPPTVDDLVKEVQERFGATAPRDVVERIHTRSCKIGVIPPAEAFGNPDDEP